MKYLLYSLSSLLIFAPFVIWLGIKISTPNDVIVHDTYVGAGSFTTSPKTFACISVAVGFIILAIVFHGDFKREGNEEVLEVDNKLVQDNPSQKITLEHNGEVLDAGKGCFWSKPVYNKSKDICYIIKNRGDESGFHDPEVIVKSTSTLTKDVLSQSDLGEGSSIIEIFKVSEDGARIFVNLHYMTQHDINGTVFQARPVFVDVGNKKIIEIEP
jgi:hypothetical protein